MSDVTATKLPLSVAQARAWLEKHGATQEWQQVLITLLVLVLTVAAFQKFLCRRKKPRKIGSGLNDATGDDPNSDDLIQAMGAPPYPHEEGAFCPPMGGLVLGNSEHPCEFENELCTGRCLALHRATYDSKLNKSGKYRYGDYFLGKKRIWEMRIQFTLKKKVDMKDLYFGIENYQYVPVNPAAKRTMSLLVPLIKTVVGPQIYHSVGDDPSVVSGELERPHFVMPMWAFDQTIETPPGEAPPLLNDPRMPQLGWCRTKRVKQYKEEVDGCKGEVGYTYTLNFWGISQWLDKLNWLVKTPMSNLDFSEFCGRPPVHVEIYKLMSPVPGQEADKRHLSSRKEFFFKLSFWCSRFRPARPVLRELLGPCLDDVVVDKAKRLAERGNTGLDSNQSWLTCCSSR